MAAGERDRLRYFLDQQRAAVLAVVDGLTEDQWHTAVLPSGWTVAGLVEHLAEAEQLWFRRVVGGLEPAPPEQEHDGGDGSPDAQGDPFTTRRTGAAVVEHYRARCRVSDAILGAADLDAPLRGEHGLDWPGEPITDARWVALHMLEETARHLGHLDAARELLDGVTGLGPR